MTNSIQLNIQQITQETNNAITIHFAQPEEKLQYLSGQFLTLIVEINGKEERRSYSISSSPYTDKTLSVTIKRVLGGLVSNYLNNNSKIGNVMMVLPPIGNFKFEPLKEVKRDIVLIGGGSGITPLISILKTAIIKEPNSKVYLVYVNTNLESTIFYTELQKWKAEFPSRLNVVHYWSDEVKSLENKKGFFAKLFRKNKAYSHRIDNTRMKSIISDLKPQVSESTVFYICGPAGLMKTAEETIYELGFPKHTVRKENFGNTSTKYDKTNKVKNSIAHNVKIILKGKEHKLTVLSGKSILYAGLEAGLDMSFSCQSGNCSACMGKCLSGKIEMSESDGLTEDQIENGYVLTCVGYPTSDDVLIEF